MSRSGVVLAVLIGGVAVFAAAFLFARGDGPKATAASPVPQVAPAPNGEATPAVPRLARVAALPRRVPARRRTSPPIPASPGATGPTNTATSTGTVGTGRTGTPGSTGSGTATGTTQTSSGGTPKTSPGDVTVGGGSLGGP